MNEQTILAVLSELLDLGITDLDILESFDYRCAYCFALLPVYANLNNRRHVLGQADSGMYTTRPQRRQYSGFHLDHVEPLVRGGPSTCDNLVPACARCNLRKGARALPVWLLSQLPAPKRRSVWDPPLDE